MAVDPQQVTAGVDKIVEILYDGGVDGHSVSIVRKGRDHHIVARRWNGEEGKSLGFPTSFGRPTWDFLSREEGIILEAFYRAQEHARG